MDDGHGLDGAHVLARDALVWTTDVDIGDAFLNAEHTETLHKIDQIAQDFANCLHIDALYKDLAQHFAHEEKYMDDLLVRLHRSFEAYKQGCNLEDDDDDPIFEEDIVMWCGVDAGTKVKVDLRDYVLTEESVAAHKHRHAILLEDTLIIRRKAKRLSRQGNDKAESRETTVQSKFDNDPAGRREASFISNWYTEHLRTDDMTIQYTLQLCQKLEQATRKKMFKRKTLQRGRHILKSLDKRDSKIVKVNESMQLQSDDLKLIAQVRLLPALMLTQTWMASIQKQTICAVGIFEPILRSNNKAHHGFRLIFTSAAWLYITGYEPWLVLNVDAADIFSRAKASEGINLLEKVMTTTDRPPIDSSEIGAHTDIICGMMMMPLPSKTIDRSLNTLMVLVPVTLKSLPYGLGHTRDKLHIAALFFVFPDTLTKCKESAQWTNTGHLFQLHRSRQQSFLDHSLLWPRTGTNLQSCSDDSARLRSRKQSEWRNVPLSHSLFCGCLQDYVFGLLHNGFLEAELPGLCVTLLQHHGLARRVIAHRRALLISLGDMLDSHNESLADGKNSSLPLVESSDRAGRGEDVDDEKSGDWSSYPPSADDGAVHAAKSKIETSPFVSARGSSDTSVLTPNEVSGNDHLSRQDRVAIRDYGRQGEQSESHLLAPRPSLLWRMARRKIGRGSCSRENLLLPSLVSRERLKPRSPSEVSVDIQSREPEKIAVQTRASAKPQSRVLRNALRSKLKFPSALEVPYNL